MSQFLVLLKREYWEHRNVFLVLPAVITALLIALAILSTSFGTVNVQGDATKRGDVTLQREGDDRVIVYARREFGAGDTRSLKEIYADELERLKHMDAAERTERMAKVLKAPVGVLRSVIWFVVYFYLLGSLYDERKDRSVLFWKSMPVSDSMTVLSKLVAGAVLIPAIVFPMILVAQLALLLIATVVGAGTGSDLWALLWQPAQLHVTWFRLLLTLLVEMLWCLPIYAWVLLVSAWARTVPIVWVLAVPAAIGIAEKLFLGGTLIAHAFAEHVILGKGGIDLVATPDLWAGVLVAFGLFFLTVFVRRRGDEA